MTNAPETGSENRLHFSGAGFWYVSCKSVTGFIRTRNQHRLEHCSISKPETGVHVTEMMIYHRLLFIVVISYKQSVNGRVVIYLFIFTAVAYSRVYFCASNFHSGCIWYENRRQKMEPIYGAGFWRGCDGYNNRRFQLQI